MLSLHCVVETFFYDFLVDPRLTHVMNPQQPVSVSFSNEGAIGMVLSVSE